MIERKAKRRIHKFDFSKNGSHVALVDAAANGHTTVLYKAAAITDEDLQKATDEVQVTLSFRDFLERFFGMWRDEADKLASLLGYETDRGEDMAEEPAIQLLKQADQSNDPEAFLKGLSTPEALLVLKLQETFEKGHYSKSKKESEDGGKDGKKDKLKKGDKPIMDKEQVEALFKSEHMQELIAAQIEKAREEGAQAAKDELQADLEKAANVTTELEALRKEKEEIQKAKYVELVKGYSFVAAEDKDELAVALFKAASLEGGEKILEALEKAQDIAKEFGEEVHGVEGEGEDLVGVEKSHSRVKELIKSRKAK